MINFTLTINAAPELLAAISEFTSSITAAKVVKVPETSLEISTVSNSAPSYTLEQLAAAATSIVDAGKRTELVRLLDYFGVQALTALPKKEYGAFAAQLKALGAKI